jgi:hypothetical protein
MNDSNRYYVVGLYVNKKLKTMCMNKKGVELRNWVVDGKTLVFDKLKPTHEERADDIIRIFNNHGLKRIPMRTEGKQLIYPSLTKTP